MLRRRSAQVTVPSLIFAVSLVLLLGDVVGAFRPLYPPRAWQSTATQADSVFYRGKCKAPASTSSVTALYFMNWFSSKDGDGKDAKNQDALTGDGNGSNNNNNRGALTGVASIMESMDSFKKSQRIGKMTGALTQELRLTTVEGVAENGKVKVVVDCQQRPVSAFIDESFFETADASDVAAAITVAMKDAHTKSTEKMEEKMKGFFNELGLPQLT